ncbi:MAG: hypothetical protein HN348_21715, partial [Proteobacteria bacterium]|nr:hypothetical protein [Pseudomonadota bacterium]
MSLPAILFFLACTTAPDNTISAGGNTTCIVEGGKVVCWGRQHTTPQDVPGEVQIFGTLSDDVSFQQVAVGPNEVCAIHRQGGTCWDPQRTSRFEITNPRSIVVDHQQRCVIDSNREVLCWGGKTASEEPTRVEGIADAIAIDTHQSYTCAARRDGEVDCWGSWGSDKPHPPKTVAGIQGAFDVAVASDSACVATKTGLACWGSRAAPELSDVVQVAAGSDFFCARRVGGLVSCWGDNRFGQLGDGSKTPSEAPVSVKLKVKAEELTAGDEHACIRTALGEQFCWGRNQFGQLGNGVVGNLRHSAEPRAIGDLNNAVQVHASDTTSCVAREDGSVWCTGKTIGGGGAHTSTLEQIGGINSAISVATGEFAACALLDSKELNCWNNVPFEPPRIDDKKDHAWRTPQDPFLDEISQLSITSRHGCTIRKNNTFCWGDNNHAQMGWVDFTSANRPMLVPTHFDAVSTGHGFTCGIDCGRIWCAGLNNAGQLGREGETNVFEMVEGVTDAIALDSGWAHSCAIRQTGGVVCWGDNSQRTLGTEAGPEVHGQVEVAGLDKITQVAAGKSVSCALQSTGQVYCWGQNTWGEVGDGTTTPRL